MIPFLALTVAESDSVSFYQPNTSVKLPAPSSTCKLYERIAEPPVSIIVVSGLYVTLMFELEITVRSFTGPFVGLEGVEASK